MPEEKEEATNEEILKQVKDHEKSNFWRVAAILWCVVS